jgi:hypothetical protein
MSSSTRWCLLCGAEYVGGVLECADCLVPLSDRRPLGIDELVGPDDESIAYDFDELEPIQRLAIDERFAEAGIAHAWDDTSLVIREEDEEAADQIIDEADNDAVLESDAEQVVYELEDWDDARREELVAALDAASIEHAFDGESNLVVFENDEERVDAIVDAIEFPDQLPVPDEEEEVAAEEQLEADAGLDPQDVLSELFVAADRLMHDATDHEGVLAMVDGAGLAETLPLPYGFAPAIWQDILGQVTGLRDSIEGDADDETIIEAATTLRTTLRQYV